MLTTCSQRVRLSTIVAPASCAAYLVCWLLNPGAASGQPAATLTAMDYVQIQQPVNRLNFALDYCGNRGRALRRVQLRRNAAAF
jgi:hypothetical protein